MIKYILIIALLFASCKERNAIDEERLRTAVIAWEFGYKCGANACIDAVKNGSGDEHIRLQKIEDSLKFVAVYKSILKKH